MILRYDIVALPKKLQEEMSVLDENFRILYESESLKVQLFDIRKLAVQEIDPDTEEVISKTINYEKRTVEVQQDEEGNDINVDVWTPYAFDVTVIDGIINAHVPVPINPDLTLEERIDRLELLELEREGII